ncbi:MAG: hypothetical protein F6K26_29915 [Moorea sp. SIO2I5]|nr:hypothetical protein [Moorena sp. SIO2I5]
MPRHYATLVVRYGADYPNLGYDTKHHGKSAPNAPYATLVWNRHVRFVG